MVSNTSSEYNENRSIWEANRAAYKGQKYIKEGGTKYLPAKGYHREQGMESGKPGLAEYTVFAQRALWFDATYRTVQAMMGLIFRRNIFIKDAEKYTTYIKDFTVDGKTLETASELLSQEVILQGRAGILVSYPDIDTADMSQKDIEDKGIHAYSAIYKTEDIINWRLERIDGIIKPTLVVLQEKVAAPWNTQFETQEVAQYRVLSLDEEGYYKQATYFLENGRGLLEKDDLTGAYPDKVYYPRMNGEKMTDIPFFPVSVSGVLWEIERSPMSGIVDMNIGHYRNSAELEAAISMTSSPTLVISGFDVKQGEKIILGGSNALILSDTAGSASFLEYEGNGINSIADAMKVKKQEMASLGLKILTTENSVNEGAETATINGHGQKSVLANIANSISDAVTSAMKLMIQWDDPKAKTDDIRVQLNTDFTPNVLSSNTINALTVLWKSMGISDLEMFDILKRGEVIPAEMTFKEHQKQIRSSVAYSLFMEEGEELEDKANTKDKDGFLAPVDVNRLTKPEDPGEPNASKKVATDPGGSQIR